MEKNKKLRKHMFVHRREGIQLTLRVEDNPRHDMSST